MHYFNDHDVFAVQWLTALQARGLLPVASAIDHRSILDVAATDLAGFRRVHLFAGIAGWHRALELARWPDWLGVWTCSCPCQPFSGAGKRGGERDARHLWPVARDLVEECRPPVIVGEQVASPDGRRWLAGVRASLEDLGYRFAAADLCAAGVKAPHIRQRLLWVADADGVSRRLPDDGSAPRREMATYRARDAGAHDGLGDAECARLEGHAGHVDDRHESGRLGALASRPAAASGGFDHWRDAEWIDGADGSTRRVKPGLQLLAHGLPRRVGRLRGYGNAIVPQVAALFLRAYLDTLGLE